MILVTGASGLIGFEVCRLLDKAGAEYCYTTNTHPVHLRGKQLQLDLTISEKLQYISESLANGVIIHCAAVIPGMTAAAETYVADLNRKIDHHVFRLAREINAKVIYLSTTAVYGSKIHDAVNESNEIPLGELTPYSLAKLESEEQLLVDDGRNVALRINAPYGIRQRSRTVLRIFIESALINRDISFHGSGKRSQDFTHASDIAKLIVKCIDSTASGVFNVSYGQPISMKELAEVVKAKVPNCLSRVGPSGLEDTQENYRALFDISKAIRELEWQPQISLEDGIERWVKMFRA